MNRRRLIIIILLGLLLIATGLTSWYYLKKDPETNNNQPESSLSTIEQYLLEVEKSDEARRQQLATEASKLSSLDEVKTLELTSENISIIMYWARQRGNDATTSKDAAGAYLYISQNTVDEEAGYTAAKECYWLGKKFGDSTLLADCRVVLNKWLVITEALDNPEVASEQELENAIR